MKLLEFIFPIYGLHKYLWDKLQPQHPQEPGRVPQTSCYGRALPLCYGMTRMTGNYIYWIGVNVRGEPGAVQGMVAICEGPINGIARVWQDKHIWDFASLGTLKTGTRPTQAVWDQLSGDSALGYPGTAIVHPPWIWSSFGVSVVGQASYEVQGMLYDTGGTAGDANPADLLSGPYSMLTNEDFGARFPYEVVTDAGRDGTAASSFRRYVEQEGLWLSPALTDQRPSKEQLESILDCVNSTCLWTEGKLEIVPLGDRDSGTYTAPTTVQYAIEPGDLLDMDGSRLEIEMPPEGDSYNIHPIEFLERDPAAAVADPAHAYNVSTVEDPDPVDVALRGERRAPVEQMHHICLRDVALKVSRIRAQLSIHAKARYKFRLPWRYARLQPLDIVTVRDPLIGLSNPIALRIQRIREDRTRQLEIRAIEWPMGVGFAVAHDTQSSDSAAIAGLGLNEIITTAERKAFCRYAAGASPPIDSWGVATLDAATGRIVGISSGMGGFSADGGLTWTAATTAPAAAAWIAMCSSATKLVAVAPYSDQLYTVSTDGGVNWSGGALPGSAVSYSGVASDGSGFVAVAPLHAAYSSDGTTWNEAASFPSAYMAKVIWTGRSYCALLRWDTTTTKDKVTRSTDGGQTWSTPVDLPPTTTAFTHAHSLVAGNGVLLALGSNTTCRSLDDGVTWEAITGETYQYVGTFTGRQFIVLAGSGLGKIQASLDGSTWDDVDVIERFAPDYNALVMVFDGHQLALLGSGFSSVSNPVGI